MISEALSVSQHQNGTLPFVTARMTLDNITLNEIKQTHRHSHCMTPVTGGIRNSLPKGVEGGMVVARALEVGEMGGC